MRARGRPTGENWHREGVGGLWNEIGKLQLDFLVSCGLRPEHYLLDIGCGSLRGGVHFIGYLDAGHYYGIDKEESLLAAGRDIELKRHHLERKNPCLLLIDDFDLASISTVEFDFMFAQSVFTHLAPEIIELCLKRVTLGLKPEGKLFATFSESKDGGIDVGKPHSWRTDERSGTKYPFSLFQEIASRTGISVEYMGDWDHPRNQKMLVFSRGLRHK